MKKFKQIFDDRFLKPQYKWKEKKVFKFTWEYCGDCEAMFVRCPKCGNNCCNGGFGTVTKDKGLPTDRWDNTTKDCDVCNLAYEYQRLAREAKLVPPVNKKEKQRVDGETKKFWKNLNLK
jgi:hypothetical protein